MAQTIAIISIKGGVGKTTTVTNLGAALAHEFGKRVLLVDANFSAANLGLHLGIVNPELTLHEVLAGKAEIKESIQNYEGLFDVIPASIVPKKIDPLSLKDQLKKIKDDYDVVLIDSSPSLNEEILAAMMAADCLFVVTTPDYPTLSCTMHAVKVAKRRKTPIKGLILNKVRNRKFELSIEDIENSTDVPVLAVIPDEVNILESLAYTKPAIVHSKPYKEAIVEYKKLAATIIGEEYQDKRVLPKIKQYLLRSIPKHEVNRALYREGFFEKNQEE